MRGRANWFVSAGRFRHFSAKLWTYIRQLRELEEGIAEYERLLDFYPKLGYRPVLLPKADIETRTRFILQQIGAY